MPSGDDLSSDLRRCSSPLDLMGPVGPSSGVAAVAAVAAGGLGMSPGTAGALPPLPPPAWLPGSGPSRADPLSGTTGAGAGGTEGPVFSNGVLVPRPSLWGGGNASVNGGPGRKSNGLADAPGSPLTQSRLRSAGGSGEGLGVGGTTRGSSSSRNSAWMSPSSPFAGDGGGGGASTAQPPAFGGSSNGHHLRPQHRYPHHHNNNGVGAQSGNVGGGRDGSTATAGGINNPQPQREVLPPLLSTRSSSATGGRSSSSLIAVSPATVSGSTNDPSASDAGESTLVAGNAGGGSGSGKRLAWIGDQRQLLPRPSATLQLRRHTAAASSGMHNSPSKTAAAYLGRLDLVAPVPDRRNHRRAAGGVGAAGNGSRAWAAAGGVARMISSPLSSSRRWSVEGGAGDSGGGSRTREVVVGRVDGAEGGCGGGSPCTDDGVTLSSSGVSGTSEEDSEDVDEDEAVSSALNSMGDDGPSGDGGSSTAKVRVVGSSETNRSWNNRQHPAIVSNGRKHLRVVNVASVADEAAAAPANAIVHHVFSAGKQQSAGGADGIGTESCLSGGVPSDAAGIASAVAAGRQTTSRKKKKASSTGKGKSPPVSIDYGDIGTEQKNSSAAAANAVTANFSASRSDVSDARKDPISIGGWEKFDPQAAERRALRRAAAAAEAAARTNRSARASRKAIGKEPIVTPPPPPGPRKWPARPLNRALVYAAAAEASRRARGFTGWVFPALPPPPPPPPRPPSPPPQVQVPVSVPEESVAEKNVDDNGGAEDVGEGIEGNDAEEETVSVEGVGKGARRKRGKRGNSDNMFLGFARDNPPEKTNPNKYGWLPPDPLLTEEGRAAARQRAIERIAERKRQAILEELRIKV